MAEDAKIYSLGHLLTEATGTYQTPTAKLHMKISSSAMATLPKGYSCNATPQN
jgi:hypothetical protein